MVFNPFREHREKKTVSGRLVYSRKTYKVDGNPYKLSNYQLTGLKVANEAKSTIYLSQYDHTDKRSFRALKDLGLLTYKKCGDDISVSVSSIGKKLLEGIEEG